MTLVLLPQCLQAFEGPTGGGSDVGPALSQSGRQGQVESRIIVPTLQGEKESEVDSY